MIGSRKRTWGLVGLAGGSLLVLGCGDNARAPSDDVLSELMNDGEVAAVAPGLTAPPPAMTVPPRFCPNADCTGSPLAFWNFDDCNAQSAQLVDSAYTSEITHPAFRAVTAACAASVDGLGVRLGGSDDIVYAPDQPDFVFDQGLTVAAWVNPNSTTGTQSIVRKRLDSSSAFVLAIARGKLTFALRLTNGRTVVLSTEIKARRYTHVAATYDGKQALLYVDGAIAASARAAGTIAAGAGPVFVGNDASGRALVGVVDDVWLNTLAAPASVIQGLTCVRQPPTVALTPAMTAPQTAGASVPFDLAITNTDGPSCAPDVFGAYPVPAYPLIETFPAPVTIAPGQTAHLAVNVSSVNSASVGSYAVEYSVFDESAYLLQVTAQATFVVGTGPVACNGSPPATAQIIGPSPSPAALPGGVYTYSAPGLSAPTVTVLSNPDGSPRGFNVSATPGATTDLHNNYSGFGTGFDNPPCLDASGYTGVQFTVTGDLGTCTLQLELVPSENNAVPWGICTLGTEQCFGPLSPAVGVGTTIVNFSDMTGGSPVPTLDASALNDIGWNLSVPTDGVTAPCTANFTVTDVSFVGGPAAPPHGGAGGAAGSAGHGPFPTVVGAVGGAGGAP